MKRIIKLTNLLIIIALLGCARGNNTLRHKKDLGNTPYQEDSILVTYGVDPERALVMLDSAVMLNHVDDFQEQFIRATIYSKSLEEKHLDSAIGICENLLKHDSVKNNPDNHEMVLNILIAISRSKADDNEYLRWAIEKAALCREQGEEVEQLRTEAEIGFVMNHLGQTDVGLKKLDTSISLLDKPGSLDRMDAFIIAAKRKISVLEELGRHEETIPLAQRILDRINHYEQHDKDYAEDSYRLSWNEHPSDRERYLGFYRAQANGFMAQAYAMMGETDKAREHLSAFDQSDYGKTFSARSMIIPTQMALGLYDDAIKTIDKIVQNMGSDTINPNYSASLRNKAVISHANGNNAEAYDFMKRHAQLCKLLNDSLHKSDAHYYAARYHAKEQQMKIQEAENKSLVNSILAGAFALLLVITTIASIYYRRQRQLIAHKNRTLVKMINESQQLSIEDDDNDTDNDGTSSQQEDDKSNTESSTEDFSVIDATIRKERLYTSVNLQRQDICNRFGISRIMLNNMLYQHRGNASLPQYINSIRMEEAVKLMRNNPDMSITVIAESVGFSPANFRKQFVRNFGMTPIEYRQNL